MRMREQLLGNHVEPIVIPIPHSHPLTLYFWPFTNANVCFSTLKMRHQVSPKCSLQPTEMHNVITSETVS